MKWFVAFCLVFGFDYVAPTEQAVMMYSAFQARTVRHSTVLQYLKGLRDFYSRRGLTDFASPTVWTSLYRVLKGIRRCGAGSVCQKAPITPAMLALFMRSNNLTSNFGRALCACLLVTFFGFFRKSNTTAKDSSPFAPSHCISVCDITVDAARHCLKICVRSTKTVQFGERQVTVWVQGCEGHILDPVGAWHEHLQANYPPPVAPAFSYAVAAPQRLAPVTYKQLVAAAKSMAQLAGVDPALVSGHSFRRGGASYAALVGVPDMLIQRQGDWRSLCYRSYIVCPPDVHLRATKAMLQNMVGDSSKWGSALVPAAEPAAHAGLEGTSFACA